MYLLSSLLGEKQLSFLPLISNHVSMLPEFVFFKYLPDSSQLNHNLSWSKSLHCIYQISFERQHSPGLILWTPSYVTTALKRGGGCPGFPLLTQIWGTLNHTLKRPFAHPDYQQSGWHRSQFRCLGYTSKIRGNLGCRAWYSCHSGEITQHFSSLPLQMALCPSAEERWSSLGDTAKEVHGKYPSLEETVNYYSWI